MNTFQRQMIIIVAAAVLAAFFSAFESSHLTGPLGFLQMLMIPLALFPFILGAVMGGNVHTSGQPGFLIGSFVEFYLFVYVFFAWRRQVAQKRQRGA